MLEKKWILAKIKRNNTKQQVLAAAHCANACRKLIKYKISFKDQILLDAIRAALNYESYSKEELGKIKNAALAAWVATLVRAHDAVNDAVENIALYGRLYRLYRFSNAADAAAYAAADAIYSAYCTSRTLDDRKLIKSIINEYLPL